MKVLIIGGVAGGASAAARLRRLDERAEIIMLERSGYISYANCGLPYYIGKEITDKEALTLQTPKSFGTRFRVDVRVKHEALSIDRENKTVLIKDLGSSAEYTETYDKLLLAPGAGPIKPSIPGIDRKGIFSLRTVENTFEIDEFIANHQPKSAVVVGGGFIGLEMAENLQNRGIKVALVQQTEHVLPNLDFDMAAEVHKHLRQKGIDLHLSETVIAFEEGTPLTIVTDREQKIEADMVVLAIGVNPESKLAKEANLELGIRGAIVVNEKMQTSDPFIYAVGDAVQVRNLVTEANAHIPLAGPANKQGRIVADNLAGGDSAYKGSLGSSVIKVFDLTIATTGLSEETAKAAGIVYDKVVTYSASHATYYPGAQNLTIKTLFDPANGRILGAELVGREGVDKRADVLATAIRAKMTGEDLTELELCYAPPYSSAKDPVNMAGFVIENLRKGLLKEYHWDQVDLLPRDGSVTLLDTRTRGEYARGAIEKAKNIPLDELREHLDEIPRDKPVYVNCQSGLRSYLACRILAGNGFNCYNLSGGYRFYELVTSTKKLDEAPTHPCGIKI